MRHVEHEQLFIDAMIDLVGEANFQARVQV